MILNEFKGDLFNVERNNKSLLVHCISSDFKLGAGIAKTFDTTFNMRKLLMIQFPNYKSIYTNMKNNGIYGQCLVIGPVANLVTKENYWHKPNYMSLKHSLYSLRDYCYYNNISILNMPKIGCGLDKLQWETVKECITDVFGNLDIEINVYSL